MASILDYIMSNARNPIVSYAMQQPTNIDVVPTIPMVNSNKDDDYLTQLQQGSVAPYVQPVSASSPIMRTATTMQNASYEPTSGAEMEADSRSSIDSILKHMADQRGADRQNDRNLQWMSFFSKLASSKSPTLLGGLGEGAEALSEVTGKQQQNNKALDRAELEDQLKMALADREYALKEKALGPENALKLAQARYYQSGGAGAAGAGAGGATGVLAQRYMKAMEDAGTPVTFPEALYAVQTGFRHGTTLTPEGIVATPGAPAAKGALKEGEKGGELRAEKKNMQPKAESALNDAMASASVVDKTIDEVLPDVNAWTAGFVGSAASKVAGTPAYDLNAKLQTIKANIGFDKLQEMRANSPTGGALGQVSDYEEKLLTSAVKNVENAQSPAQLKKALIDLKGIKSSQQVRLKHAYELDYGKAPEPLNNKLPAETNGWSIKEKQ